MKISIILCHYKVGKITAYAVSQILKYKGNHEVDILIANNSPQDNSIEYLKPFANEAKIYTFWDDKIKSHGTGYSNLVKEVKTDYFIALESDSYPVVDNFLDYYESLVNQNVDCAGSVLQLSGGIYLHPCGTLYKKSAVDEYEKYCNGIEYKYFPNFNSREGFDCHLMIHNKVLDFVLDDPDGHFDVAKGYEGLNKKEIMQRAADYKPTVCAFHNGMGGINESVKTYGQRNAERDAPEIILNNRYKIIARVGYEPGQALYYYFVATNKKIFAIPIEVKWMKNREGQQQEYTQNAAGIHHIWGVSSYAERPEEGVEDIYKEKRELPERLYETLPQNQKIKIE